MLALKVKPLITPDNRIILDLNVSDDSVGKTIVASGGVNVPAINTQSVTTQVLVDDGETVVLGGILTTTETDNETKVPMARGHPGARQFVQVDAKDQQQGRADDLRDAEDRPRRGGCGAVS